MPDLCDSDDEADHPEVRPHCDLRPEVKKPWLMTAKYAREHNMDIKIAPASESTKKCQGPTLCVCAHCEDKDDSVENGAKGFRAPVCKLTCFGVCNASTLVYTC